MNGQAMKITGYRDLSPDEILLINEVKALADRVGVLVDKLERHAATDKRWLAIGRTDLQTGFMATIRAIARPTSF